MARQADQLNLACVMNSLHAWGGGPEERTLKIFSEAEGAPYSLVGALKISSELRSILDLRTYSFYTTNSL
jgi:hypothetical protein